jgi:outer membrane protein
MKKLTTFLIFCALMLVCMLAKAQTYSLEDVINAALANNYNLKNSQLDVDASEYRIKEVKSALLPTINIAGQSLYYRDMPAQYAPATSFGGPEGTYKKLTLGMEQNTTANLQMTQNLYNHSVRVGLKAAKVLQEASSQQTNVIRENIIYQVTATYFSIQILNDNLSRLSENIVNLEKTTKINENLKENELVSANIHNRMLINLENLRNQYENQKLVVEKNVTQLKYLMNVDMHSPLQIENFNYSQLLSEPVAGDIAQRPDIQLQQTSLRVSQLEKKSVAAGYFPVVTNTFSFGYSGYNDSFGPFHAVNNDWIRTSYFALTVKIPVFDGFQKLNQTRQKEVAIQKNLNTLSLMKNNADREVEDAFSNYRANKTLLSNNKESLDLAEKLFESARSEYEHGITSITELLNAQNDLTNARTNYSTALLNLKLAELSLKKAHGTLITNQ